METFKWKVNSTARKEGEKASVAFFTKEVAEKVRNFHQGFDLYRPTPLRVLNHLAKHMGVSGIYVKDESYRFGLNSFKALGGSYAIGRYLAQQLTMNMQDVSFEMLRSPDVKQQIGDITFATATDGNHGRGVAWAAQQLRQQAVVYMPKDSAQIRLDNIKATGARASITDLNYDNTVRYVKQTARENGWVLVQDTSWEGYTDIPTWIMQGYLTMVAEALEQMQEVGADMPTHVFIQVGVGSIAGAVQGLFASLFNEKRPITAIVEPNKADCHYLSSMAEDGKTRHVTGSMDTIMAGLACGEPNPISWGIMRDYSDMFISCPDYVSAKGMRMLGNPLGDDPRVISGESGAVTTGLISFLMKEEILQEARERLQLDEHSRILVFNTEGDTDPENYRRIVWDGAYPVPGIE
ncbi:diaminopropionate ammonia-lyase [Aneurinibacillus terranovensis]|uniref:diaminopropionate ammonia-lyase n=1 Tax=Aneurinibacillus terranovensis TaxID=278991 RepID=UPI0004136538|nr:diaminopropionate ammonia-lyase [Aneurinibacillus terranovensis]